MAEADNTGTGFQSSEAAENLLATAEGVSPMVVAGAAEYNKQNAATATDEQATTETQYTSTQEQETQTTEQPAEETQTGLEESSTSKQQTQEADQSQSTEESQTQTEAQPERKFKFGDDEHTADELLEWKKSGLREADYTNKTKELATQRKTFESQSAENLKVVDHANATKELADLIRNDPEFKEDLIAKHGDKARNAIKLAEQYDPSKFVDTRQERLDKQDVQIKQNEFLTKADAEVEAFTVNGVTITDSDRLAIKDVQYAAADKNNVILNAEQAYFQAKGQGLLGKSDAMTVEEITPGANGNGKPSTPTTVTNNHGTSVSSAGSKNYPDTPQGDANYLADLEAGKIDKYANII